LGIVEAMRIRQLTVHEVLADLSLATVSSVITVLGTVAFAGMIFSGPLAKVVPLAFVTFLTGTAVSALLVGLLSRFYCNLSGAQDQPAAILATFASGLTSMSVLDDGAAISTMFAVIVLSTASFGLTLLFLGVLRFGKYTQLVPYPVIGGFLAGVGVLLLIATIRFLSGITPTLHSLPQLFSWQMTLRWLPSLIAASLLYWGMKRIRHVLFLPIALIGILISFYIVASILSVSVVSLRESGLVFGSMPEGGVFDSIKWLSVTKWAGKNRRPGSGLYDRRVARHDRPGNRCRNRAGAKSRIAGAWSGKSGGRAGRRLAGLHPGWTLIGLSSLRSVEPLDADPAPSF
jgi:SulP family sulfate permease